MKKILSASLVLILIIIACSRKTVATQDITTNTSTEITPAETSKSNTGTVEVSSIAAGKTIYETKCARCHGLKPISDYTSERWDRILKSMVPKAKLTETETRQVTAYVKFNAKR